MTDTGARRPSPDPRRSATPPPRSGIVRLAVASGVGTSLEFFDYALYATATALVFNKIFFVVDDPWFGTFLGLTGFAVGFLLAPLGAAVFGALGDRLGRRRILTWTFLLMGAASLLMGLLPDFATIGVIAPVTLVLLRMLHGISRGGEIGGAAVLATEHAPPHRRGLYGSFVSLGSPVGALLANLSFSLVLLLPTDQVISWGWRIPFVVGALVLVVGLWSRRKVEESPIFVELQRREAGLSAAPLRSVLRSRWRRVLLLGGVNVGLNGYMFILFTFMLSYATSPAPEGLSLPRQPVVNGAIVGLIAHAIAIVLACWLTDRLGRKPVMLVGGVLSGAYAPLLFSMVSTGRLDLVIIGTIIGFFLTGFLFGPMLAYFTELFSPQERYSGVAIGFQLGVVFGGGVSPMIANRLVAVTGEPISVAWYLIGIMIISVGCLIALPETAPARIGERTAEDRFRDRDAVASVS